MDTPPEERSLFDHVTCNISASVDEVTIPGALALDLIEQVRQCIYLLNAVWHRQSLADVILFLKRLKWRLRGLIS